MVADPLAEQHGEPPPPVEVDGEEKYQVSGVEDSRVYRNQLQHLTLWAGHDPPTWEPPKFVDGLQALKQFHQCYPGKHGPLEKVLGGPQI